MKKNILGRFYGKSFYYQTIDWQDMHQIISMVSTLSLRQLILIRMIHEGFGGIDSNWFITNPSVCVELNRLLDYGIWSMDGAPLYVDNSSEIQVCSLFATTYTRFVCDALMLEKISDEDIKRVVDSLKLSAKGKPIDILTKDEYDSTSKWDNL